MKQTRVLALLAALASTVASALSGARPAFAQEDHPFVSPMFTDNMVLQRGIEDPVWGWAPPGAQVTVRMSDKEAVSTANAGGQWFVKIGPFPVGGPYTLTVSGPQTETFQNVLVGDVWICSGQSNMEFGIGNLLNPQAEIDQANYPNIRLYTVGRKVAADPQPTSGGSWLVCTPQNIKLGVWNGFSAVGYFFGRDLYQKLNVPIGLIHTSWGGTLAEAWTSEAGLKKMDDFKPLMEQMDASRAARDRGGYSYANAFGAWYQHNDPGTSGQPYWADPALDTSKWPTMSLPGYWEQAGVPELAAFDGVVWFRKEVDVPADVASRDTILHLLADDNDTTYVNGRLVGASEGASINRRYLLPAGTLKAGKNVIAVRVLDTGGYGGIYGAPEQLAIEVPHGTNLPLAGPWQYRIGVDLKKATALPVELAPNNPNLPTVLYNGMIAPVVPYAIKGAIWYQGESNAGRAYQYRELLPTLIDDWRQNWDEGDFPFYIVQLANYTAPPTAPGDSEWAELREAQALTAKNVKNAGEAVIIDLGDARDIHPKDKQDVGYRLSLLALANTYGQKVEFSGPVYKSMKAHGGEIRLRFDHVGGGLVAKGGDKLIGFAIAGKDKHFVWADAKIDGDSVVVSSPDVPNPVAVRYAWANNPPCNLYNQAGLPASPFRTDDWPGVTVGRK